VTWHLNSEPHYENILMRILTYKVLQLSLKYFSDSFNECVVGQTSMHRWYIQN
jgi:hypothetical protein